MIDSLSLGMVAFLWGIAINEIIGAFHPGGEPPIVNRGLQTIANLLTEANDD